MSSAAGVSSTTWELPGVTRCPGDAIHSPAGIRRSHHRPSFVMGGSAGWARPMASEAGLAARQRPGQGLAVGGTVTASPAGPQVADVAELRLDSAQAPSAPHLGKAERGSQGRASLTQVCLCPHTAHRCANEPLCPKMSPDPVDRGGHGRHRNAHFFWPPCCMCKMRITTRKRVTRRRIWVLYMTAKR